MAMESGMVGMDEWKRANEETFTLRPVSYILFSSPFPE